MAKRTQLLRGELQQAEPSLHRSSGRTRVQIRCISLSGEIKNRYCRIERHTNEEKRAQTGELEGRTGIGLRGGGGEAIPGKFDRFVLGKGRAQSSFLTEES